MKKLLFFAIVAITFLSCGEKEPQYNITVNTGNEYFYPRISIEGITGSSSSDYKILPKLALSKGEGLIRRQESIPLKNEVFGL